jgi:hypothetical protein
MWRGCEATRASHARTLAYGARSCASPGVAARSRGLAEIAAPARPRRREWLRRAAFEGTLILLGLLGAFALDEWQDRATLEQL